ncbi:hypothetical protein K491DRAFT_694495 [Lophiostoma macrostomum CBS 122681]|uniref:Uncharacterized protein n=1 Tax=Lophiostoma macrostomum CBS 122681 TaxID=1314788 RepID=A0A6A6T0S0_9PLEO|nr:hypothetical protein K491DRAFT_694495 [Lophiostoma macrostomum CBS 122681]
MTPVRQTTARKLGVLFSTPAFLYIQTSCPALGCLQVREDLYESTDKQSLRTTQHHSRLIIATLNPSLIHRLLAKSPAPASRMVSKLIPDVSARQ